MRSQTETTWAFNIVEDGSGQPIDADIKLFGMCNNRNIKLSSSTTNGYAEIKVPPSFVPSLLHVFPNAPLFWQGLLKNPQSNSTLCCKRIVRNGHLGWWHRCVGIQTWSQAAGEGITIGILDRGFVPTGGISHAKVTEPDGSNVSQKNCVDMHGEVICRIIGQRPNSPNNLGGIAPGARIVCIAANSKKSKLDSNKLIDGIYTLVVEENADIINISAGLQREIPDLLERIQFAEDMGSLCVASAGNDHANEVSFPAQHGECVAVGAIGRCGWPPPGTMAEYQENLEPKRSGRVPNFGDVYHWAPSSYGKGLDLIAPGAAVIAPMDDEGYDISGTSFAAPIVCGLLAVALSNDAAFRCMERDRYRLNYMKDCLFRMCRQVGIGTEFEGKGVPILGSAHAPVGAE